MPNDIKIPKLSGICYGAFRNGQSPIIKIYPNGTQIKQDLDFLKKYLANKALIRCYSTLNIFNNLPKMIQKAGFKAVPSCSLDYNQWTSKKEINNLINLSQNKIIDQALVGDLPLSGKVLTYEELVDFIRLIKKYTKIRISVSEHWHAWLKYRELFDEVDFISIGIYPYQDGIALNEAIVYIDEIIRKVKKLNRKNKKIIIDSGWPSKGRTIGRARFTHANQKQYIINFLKFCHRKKIKYFVFEAFDEDWKKVVENSSSAHLGIFPREN